MNRANLKAILTALAGLFLLGRHLPRKELGAEDHHFIRQSKLFGVEEIDR